MLYKNVKNVEAAKKEEEENEIKLEKLDKKINCEYEELKALYEW